MGKEEIYTGLEIAAISAGGSVLLDRPFYKATEIFRKTETYYNEIKAIDYLREHDPKKLGRKIKRSVERLMLEVEEMPDKLKKMLDMSAKDIGEMDLNTIHKYLVRAPQEPYGL